VRSYNNRLLAVATAALLLSLLLHLAFGNEPCSAGRPLSYWVRSPINPRTQEAITDIGTNAIPHLLRWLEAEPVSWRL
jgi:hypothetical protein